MGWTEMNLDLDGDPSYLLEAPEIVLDIVVEDINVSWNAIYSSKGTYVRKRLKKEWHGKFSAILNELDSPEDRGFEIVKYRLSGSFNTRMDVGNHVVMKFLNDVLQERGWVTNDNPRFCVEERYRSDKRLPSNSGRFTVEAEIKKIQ